MEYHGHDPVQMEEEISSRGFLFCFQVSPDGTSSRTLVEEEKKKKENRSHSKPRAKRRWRSPCLALPSRPANQHKRTYAEYCIRVGEGGHLLPDLVDHAKMPQNSLSLCMRRSGR